MSTPLPPRSRAALAAIIDTLLPPLPDANKRSFLQARASALGAVEAAEKVVLEGPLSISERRDMKLLLRALSTGVGTAAVCCSLTPPLHAFADRSAAEREALLLRLADSRLGLHRQLFLGLKRLLLPICVTFTPEAPYPVVANPFQRWLGYPGPELPLAQPAGEMVDFRLHGLPAGASRFDCDVVVIGSGAGGGVAAAKLAEAGLRVVVLEKGAFVPPAELSCDEMEAFGSLYEKGGLLTTDDGAISVLAGATLGGGTTVNWACCLPPPPAVRDEWASRFGLARLGAGSKEFDASVRAVMARIGATDEGVQHNGANRKLIEGCEALGLGWRVAAQNLRDTSSAAAGWTCFGDRAVNKQGGLATYLADAARAGAKFVERAAVQRVVWQPTDGTPGRRRAAGVVATTPEGTLELRAARGVVVAAGALHSPCVLLRSGLRRGGVGRHLRLHPVTGVAATFDEEMRASMACNVPTTAPTATAALGGAARATTPFDGSLPLAAGFCPRPRGSAGWIASSAPGRATEPIAPAPTRAHTRRRQYEGAPMTVVSDAPLAGPCGRLSHRPSSWRHGSSLPALPVGTAGFGLPRTLHASHGATRRAPSSSRAPSEAGRAR